MEDNIGRIFKEGLFQIKKDPNRDWVKIADKSGQKLYDEIGGMFSHPEVALCALVHCMAELAMCAEKSKRSLLIERLKDAVKDRVACFESEDGEEPESEDGEDYPEEDGKEEDSEEEPSTDGLPGPDPEDEEPEDEDPDQGFPGPRMPGRISNDNPKTPAKEAGFQPKKRHGGEVGK